jgi:hypothetical protein
MTIGERDKVSVGTLGVVLSLLRESGREGMVLEDVVGVDESRELVEVVLALLVESKFAVSQVVRRQKRYYHAVYY